jgi:serine/threonine-protein phosphatase 2A regulatory subunit A
MPLVGRLSEDPSEHVRAALASVILGLAPLLGREGTIGNLLPLLLRLLKDPTPQVRLNVISRLEAVNSVIGLSLLSQSLIPAIVELAGDRQWRVRQAIIDFMPLLGSQLGPDFFNDEGLARLVTSEWLRDPVAAIRTAAVGNLRRLTEVSSSQQPADEARWRS